MLRNNIFIKISYHVGCSESNWNYTHTDLSKYFIEKIKQRVDHQEIISKKHRTTNGFTLIYEIREVSRQSIKEQNLLID
jgi:hypothetical protein